MRKELRTPEEIEAMRAEKLVNDIANAGKHITKLTERANAESDQTEKSRLLALVELHTNHKANLLNAN